MINRFYSQNKGHYQVVYYEGFKFFLRRLILCKTNDFHNICMIYFKGKHFNIDILSYKKNESVQKIFNKINYFVVLIYAILHIFQLKIDN